MAKEFKEASRPLPPSPANEEERLRVLRVVAPAGGLGDGAPEDPMLQALCRTICKLFTVPVAGVSLVQQSTYTMRASQGLPAQFKVPRHDAFCAWTLLGKSPEVMIVEDMTKDHRFSEHPYVIKASGGFRFYAGAPLVACNSHLLGAVCILDITPRRLKAEELNILANFSELAVRRMEGKCYNDARNLYRNAKLVRSAEEASQAILLCDLGSSRWWRLLFANSEFINFTGVSDADLVENSFWKIFRPASSTPKNKILEQVEQSIGQQKDFVVEACTRDAVLDNASAAKGVFRMHFRPATKQQLGQLATQISVPNFADALDHDSDNGVSSLYFAAVTKDDWEDPAPPKARLGFGRQQSFYSQEFTSNFPVTSKQPLDEGIKDVALGVLCAQHSNGLLYRGRWRKRPVSIKVIEAKMPSCVREASFGAAYVPKEAALSLDLNHANILKSYKLVVENNSKEKSVKAWLVQEWAGVGNLGDAIHRGWLRRPDGSPNMTAVLAVAADVAAGLAYLHEEGIVLGYLTAGSVLLSSEDNGSSRLKDYVAKLADFSYSFRADNAPIPTSSPNPSHIAPEIYAKGHVGKASDIFAFGMLWWEMCNSQTVWPSLSADRVQRRILNKETPRMPVAFPEGYQALLEDCLAHSPSQRPTCKDVKVRLAIMLQQEAKGAEVTGVLAEKEAPSAQKIRLLRDRLSLKKTILDTKHESLKETRKGSLEVLEQASLDAIEQPKRSMFRRFAAKLKV